MNTSVTSYSKRRRELLYVFVANYIACIFVLIFYMTTKDNLTKEMELDYTIKTFELMTCKAFSFTIAVLEICGESTNSHVHIIITIYTLLEVLFNRPEHTREMNIVLAILFVLKSITIQRSKILERQLSGSEALPALLWETKKFLASKRTYGRFLSFLCFKDFFIGRFYKVRREYFLESILLIANLLIGIMHDVKPKLRFVLEATTVILIATLKCIIIADTIPEMGFSSVLSFVVAIIYLFFTGLFHNLNSLNINSSSLRQRKNLLEN